MTTNQENQPEKKDPRKEYKLPKDLDRCISDTEKLLTKFRDAGDEPDEEDLKEDSGNPSRSDNGSEDKKGTGTPNVNEKGLPERWRGPGPKPEPLRKRRLRDEIGKYTQVLQESLSKIDGDLDRGKNVLRIVSSNAKSIENSGGRQKFEDAANFQKEQNKNNSDLRKKISDFLKTINDVLTEGRKVEPEDDEDDPGMGCCFPPINLPPIHFPIIATQPREMTPPRPFPSTAMQSAISMGPPTILKGPFGL